jgi:hypothetical protein
LLRIGVTISSGFVSPFGPDYSVNYLMLRFSETEMVVNDKEKRELDSCK